MDPIRLVFREGNELKFNLKEAKEILYSVGERPLVIYAVVGIPNTGKSYLLNWFAVCLDKLSELLKNLPENVRTIDDFNNLIIGIDFLKQSEYVQRFNCNEGASGGTTGVLLSQPFILSIPEIVNKTIQPNKKEVAVLLLDAEGFQDLFKKGRDSEQDERILILTTLMSSVLIINDAGGNQFLQDKTYKYFNCFCGYGGREQQYFNEDESRNKPFQKVVFLKRNWDDTDSYDYGFHNKHVPEDKNIFKAQLTPTNVEDKTASNLLNIIHNCFSDLSAFLLANPGSQLRKDKSVDNTCDEFKQNFKKFIYEMLKIERADGITLKEIDRCKVTGVDLILYLENWINTLDQKQEKEMMLADVMSKLTAETKCFIAKNNAVKYYHLEMYNTVISSDPPVPEELFNIEHKEVLQKCLDIFHQQKCSFRPDIEKHYLQEAKSEINRLMDLLRVINISLHKHAKAQLAIVRASQEFLSNPIKGKFTYEIINLYHQATVWAYEGEHERADECYEQIKKWSMESRDLRVDSLEQVDELEVNSDEHIYQMRQLPRGYCVIINNEHFESFSTRNGSQADVTGLAMVFRNLGFIISIHQNLTKKDMCLRLHEISKDKSLCNHDAIVIAILSHGDNDFIYGSDATGIKHYDIFNMFSTSHCPQLRGKPKIFLNQFCRGHNAFSGSIRLLRNSDTGDGVADTHALKTDSKASSLSLNTDGVEGENGNNLPLTDAVIWYSTLENYVSYRDIKTGTYFIQAFVKVMEKADPKKDFISIAQDVNLEVQTSLGEQATELKLIGWSRKLYLKTIDADKKRIHVNPSFFETILNENMEVILVEDESLLEKMNDKNNILETTEEDGIRLKMFKKPSLDSVISSDENDLRKQYHILFHLEDNESNQTFRMHSSDSKQQIDNIFKSYSKHFIPFTRYYIDKIGNGKINAHQLENIYQYITEFPDHSLIHFAAAFGCTRYFEQQTNAPSSKPFIAQCLVNVNENAENTHMTPIHAALVSRYNMHNKKIVVEKLLALGANLSARDKYRNTVLHFSANTNKEIVGILLRDHDIRHLRPKQDLCNCINEQPHDWAAYFGNIEVYQLLFEFYNQNETDSDFLSNFQITENIDTDSRYPSTFAQVALKIGLTRFKSYVLKKEQISLFIHLNLKYSIYPSLNDGKYLIKLEVNVNAMNPEGDTPLQLICANTKIKEKYHKLDWIILLLSANADTDAQNKDKNTALHYLVSLDDRMGVKALLVFGADPRICNNFDRTPYRLATNNIMMELLKQIGLDVINDKATMAKEPVSSNLESVGTRSIDITPSSSTTNLIPSSSKLPWKRGNTTGSKVLCLDGGGIKGLNSLVILDEIEKITKKSIVEYFDWIVGTSTGGIIALALAAGRTVRQCKNLYFKLKDKIFGNVMDKITGHNSARLEKILQTEFLEMKMSNLMESKIKVAITTTASINGNPTLVVYPNYVIKGWDEAYEFKDELVWRVGRMTSAAPWYFKPVGNSFDGGLLANNPTLDALVQVSKYNESDQERASPVVQKSDQERGSPVVQKSDQVRASPVVQKSDQERAGPFVVSVGTGSWLKENTNDSESQNSYASRTSASEVVNLFINSATKTDGNVVDQAILAVNDGSYIRIQPLIKTEIKMDETNTKKLLNMMWETKVFMYQNREQINEFMNNLK